METMAWRRGSTSSGTCAPPRLARLARWARGPPPPRSPPSASPGRRASAERARRRVAAAPRRASPRRASPPPPPRARPTRRWSLSLSEIKAGGSFDEDVTPPRRKARRTPRRRPGAAPLRSGATPSRPARLPSGAAASLSAAGAGGGERCRRGSCARAPAGPRRQDRAQLPARVLRKVMRTSARRLADLCAPAPAAGADQAAYDLVSRVVYEHTKLLYNRHLDQILLCGVRRVQGERRAAPRGGRAGDVQGHHACYHKQPQCREETFWTVSLEQATRAGGGRRGGVISSTTRCSCPRSRRGCSR